MALVHETSDGGYRSVAVGTLSSPAFSWTAAGDANATGWYADLTAGAERVLLAIGGIAGPTWNRSGSAVSLGMTEGGNITLGTATGTKIGTATTQKLGFFNATPIVQPGATTDLRTALINLGLLATGGATPLNLNGGALTAASITNSGLTTSGGVVFNTNGGLEQNSAGLTYSSNLLTIGDGTLNAQCFLNGNSGGARQIVFQSGGLARWKFVGANGTTETGGNVGSDCRWIAIADDGSTVIDTPLSLNRLAGSPFIFTRPLQPGSGSASSPSYAFSTDTTTGLFRVSSGILGFASAGTERVRFGSNLHIENYNATAIASLPSASFASISVHGADAIQGTIGLATYGALPMFLCRRAEGMAASPTQSTSGVNLFALATQGYEATTPGFTSQRAHQSVVATESYTSTAQGYRQDFFTVATGSTTNSQRMRIDQDGNVLIGTTTNGMTAGGSLAIAQDLAHRGTKAGLFNVTPVTQPGTTGTTAGFTAGAGTAMNSASTSTGGTGTKAYTFGDVVLALKQLGAMAA